MLPDNEYRICPVCLDDIVRSDYDRHSIQDHGYKILYTSPPQMNEFLRGWLLNFKFASACNYLEGECEVVRNLVNRLSDDYGNVGNFSGKKAGEIINEINAIQKIFET